MSRPLDIAPHFQFRGGRLHVEHVALDALAGRFGTPAYVYSKAALIDAYRAYAQAAVAYAPRGDVKICYAVKVNSNLAILKLFDSLGAGFDIVSGGELARVIAAGADPSKVIFSGVGKSREEMRAALDAGIFCFNVESVSELRRLSSVAGEVGRTARIALRVNPDVDAGTHPYISTGLAANKFGIAYGDAREVYLEARRLPHLAVVGIGCHIGSQLLDDSPLLAALDRLIELIDVLAEDGIAIEHIDMGGGLGIRYGNEAAGTQPPEPGDYLSRVFAHIDAWRTARHGSRSIGVMFEPGRSLVGNAGILITAVEVLKPGATKNFAVLDAAMNDLIRPSLYDAWHEVVAVNESSTGRESVWDLVGPICESGDWLARERTLKLAEGDLLAFLSAGAYGMAMASNYNTRPRAVELLVDGDDVQVIRERESIASLFSGERAGADAS